MRLTNTMRDAFVRAVMQDVPYIDYKEQMRKVATDGAIAALPPEVRNAWENPETKDYIKVSYFTVGHGEASMNITLPGTDSSGWRHPKLASAADVKKKIDDLSTKHNAQHEVRKDLEAKIKGAAYAVTTRKALAEALPEFERYLPADEAVATRNLPALANIVADFTKAGWPKGKAPAAKAKK